MHTPGMSLNLRRHISLCLLALMFLIVRTAEAHAHLCADGKEPPVSVHLADGGSHACETGAAGEHGDDKDVQIAADVVLKKPASADPAMAALFPVLFEVLASSGEPVVSVEAAAVFIEQPSFLRPPLRGPPA